jgi:hypothetical protein
MDLDKIQQRVLEIQQSPSLSTETIQELLELVSQLEQSLMEETAEINQEE